MAKKIILPNSEKNFVVLGTHKQSHLPILIGVYKLEESAIDKKDSIEKANNEFIEKLNQFNLEHQPKSAREAGITDFREYGEYQQKAVQEVNELINEFVAQNIPEFMDFQIHIIS